MDCGPTHHEVDLDLVDLVAHCFHALRRMDQVTTQLFCCKNTVADLAVGVSPAHACVGFVQVPQYAAELPALVAKSGLDRAAHHRASGRSKASARVIRKGTTLCQLRGVRFG